MLLQAKLCWTHNKIDIKRFLETKFCTCNLRNFQANILVILVRRTCACVSPQVFAGDSAAGATPQVAMELRIDGSAEETTVGTPMHTYLGVESVANTDTDGCQYCGGPYAVKHQRRLLPQCRCLPGAFPCDCDISHLTFHLPRGGLNHEPANRRVVLPKQMVTTSGRRFDFASAALHLGDMSSSGHYVAIVAHQGGFLAYDDALVWEYPFEDLPEIAQTAAVLVSHGAAHPVPFANLPSHRQILV